MAVELCVSDVKTNIMLATFSNGRLKNSNCLKDIQLYKNTNPRGNPKHKILVTDTSRLRYKAANYGVDSRAQLSSLCRTYIGILDKKTNKMHIVEPDWFDMKPILNDQTKYEDKETEEITQEKAEKKQQEMAKKITSQKEDLTMAFGSRIKQRFIESKRKLKVNLEDISLKMQNTVNQIVVKEPEPTLDPVETLTDILPPINRKAAVVADICNINDLVKKEDLDIFNKEAIALSERTNEDLEKWKEEDKFSSFELNSLTYLPKDAEAKLQKCKLLLYFRCLVALLRVRQSDVKKKGGFLDVIPNPLRTKFINEYFRDDLKRNSLKLMSPKQKDKIIAQAMAIALILDEFITNARNLNLTMTIPMTKFRSIASVLGAKIKKETGKDAEGNNRVETLVWEVPLPAIIAPRLLRK